MYYRVCGMVHLKEPLLLIGKSSPCSCGSAFPLSLNEWSFTICPTPYNHIKNVLSVSLKNVLPLSYTNSASMFIGQELVSCTNCLTA